MTTRFRKGGHLRGLLIIALLLAAPLPASAAPKTPVTDLSHFAIRGRLFSIEYNSTPTFGTYRAWVTILLPDGNALYDTPFRCPDVASCQALEAQFACTPHSTITTDPADPEITVTHLRCAPFAWNHCVTGAGHFENVTFAGRSAIAAADVIAATSDINCTPRP